MKLITLKSAGALVATALLSFASEARADIAEDLQPLLGKTGVESSHSCRVRVNPSNQRVVIDSQNGTRWENQYLSFGYAEASRSDNGTTITYQNSNDQTAAVKGLPCKYPAFTQPIVLKSFLEIGNTGLTLRIQYECRVNRRLPTFITESFSYTCNGME